MREIKFRAWVIAEERMITKRGGKTAPAIKMFTDSYGYTNNEVIVEQYTGLVDKNGTEIYEGDIVATGFQNNIVGCVEYGDAMYFVRCRDNRMYFNNPEQYEVIGNIHQHSHLLERD